MTADREALDGAPVTNDPELLARLRAQDLAGLGSRELGECAADVLGLTPPAPKGALEIPDIVEQWPAWSDEGILVWVHPDDEPIQQID